jgi:hypothetical protein
MTLPVVAFFSQRPDEFFYVYTLVKFYRYSLRDNVVVFTFKYSECNDISGLYCLFVISLLTKFAKFILLINKKYVSNFSEFYDYYLFIHCI